MFSVTFYEINFIEDRRHKKVWKTDVYLMRSSFPCSWSCRVFASRDTLTTKGWSVVASGGASVFTHRRGNHYIVSNDLIYTYSGVYTSLHKPAKLSHTRRRQFTLIRMILHQ